MNETTKIIRKSTMINASAARVWQALTDNVGKWLSDGDVVVNTTWEPQTPITFKGVMHNLFIDDKGMVLIAEKEKILQYSYFSKMARLADIPENYLIITFALKPSATETLLELTTENINDEIIYGHWNFYWTVTLDIIRRMAEESEPEF
jgi:hypothetical protein